MVWREQRIVLGDYNWSARCNSVPNHRILGNYFDCAVRGVGAFLGSRPDIRLMIKEWFMGLLQKETSEYGGIVLA